MCGKEHVKLDKDRIADKIAIKILKELLKEKERRLLIDFLREYLILCIKYGYYIKLDTSTNTLGLEIVKSFDELLQHIQEICTMEGIYPDELLHAKHKQ